MRVLEFAPSGCLAGSPVPKYATQFDQSACPTRWALFEVGAKVDAAMLYDLNGAGDCTLRGAPAAGAALYVLTKRAPDEFEPVSVGP
jgi:hypothetical protein